MRFEDRYPCDQVAIARLVGANSLPEQFCAACSSAQIKMGPRFITWAVFIPKVAR